VKKLLVFLQDPLSDYYRKGEIKPRYYNPGNFFGEVHFISFADQDISEEKVQIVAGEGRLRIHCVGKFSLARLPWLTRQIAKVVDEVKPHVVRAFDPFWAGFFAVRLGARYGIPSILSVHCDLNPVRDLRVNGVYGLGSFLKKTSYAVLLLPSTLKGASWVICAYKFACQEVKRYRRNRYDVIYNKIYTEQYAGSRSYGGHGRVLSVGRHIRGKSPENLIRALADLDRVELTLIGEGPLTGRLKAIVRELCLEDRVKFISSVPNTQIHTYYLSSDIFALPILYGGVCIPVLEAMAAGLPVVLPKPLWEETPEVIDGTALLVENTPEGFRDALGSLLKDCSLREKLGAEGRKRIETINGHLMEEREKSLYQSLCG